MQSFTKPVALLLFLAASIFGQTVFPGQSPKTKSLLRESMDRYDVSFYLLDLEISNATTYLQGSGNIKGKVVEGPLSTFVFQLGEHMQIDSLRFNGAKLSWQRSAGTEFVSINVTPALSTGEIFLLKVYYQGDPTEEGFFAAVSNGVHSGRTEKVTWSLSEPLNAKDWFPVKEVLPDKADSVYVFLTVPDGLMAGSNGLLTGITNLPGDKKRFEWKSHYPIAYYLISFCVSDYMDYRIYAHPPGIADSVLIQSFVYDDPVYLESNKALIQKTVNFMELYSELFGVYPFWKEKYGHCVAPMGGGMEHQTMTTLDNFSFYLVCHELSHSWFGDLVTCSNWQDIWLNEGFASYCEYLAAEYIGGAGAADIWMNQTMEYVKSNPGGSVFVPADQAENPSRIFNGRLSYKKGAALLHMIRHMLDDDDLFFGILRTYLQTYKNSVASVADFKKILEQQSGMDFDPFFEQWYYGEGYPTYALYWNQVNDTVTFRLSQVASKPEVTSFFQMPVEILFAATGGDTLVRVDQILNPQDYSFHFKRPVTGVTIDPSHWLLCNVGQVTAVPKDFIVGSGNMEVWPNPFQQFIFIHFNDSALLRKISIYSLNGRVIDHIYSSDHFCYLDMGRLHPGFYFLTVETEYGRTVRKVVKE
jgi:aminopeptidase N